MQVRILKTVALSLFLVTLGVASVNAQAPSPARTEARSPLSEIAHNVSTWFSRRTGTDGKQQGSLPARLLTPFAATATHGTNIRTRRADHGTIETYGRTSPVKR